MGIRLSATKQGEPYIDLTEYSIKNIIFNSDKNIALLPKINDITNSLIIEGIINFESVHEPLVPKLDHYGDQLLDENDEPIFWEREIDSVRKLANWAIIPEYLDCFCDLEITITDSAGNLVKESSYENLFIVDYWEKYDDEQGHGKFYALIRERENLQALNSSEKDEADDKPQGGTRYIVVEYTGLFEEPTHNSDVTRVLDYSTEVKWTGRAKRSDLYEFAEISALGSTGWVIRNHLGTNKPPERTFHNPQTQNVGDNIGANRGVDNE